MKKNNYYGEFNLETVEDKRQRYQFEELSKKIIGAAIKVHRELGPGFLENIYEEALKIEFSEHNIDYESQKKIKIKYLGTEIGMHRLDLLVEKKIIIELKAVKEFADIHFAQLRSYLKATGLKIGLLLNFSRPTLEIKRIVN
ncbi:MAG: GxxExxY protein [Deltaproteobacteria bacterium]|nr:GxxExxY protein [Deltaproteobacteria bacterium]